MPIKFLPFATTRGQLIQNAPLAPYSWFRVGGPADWLFLPADEADLAEFLNCVPGDMPITVLGVGSNLLIRDGGIEGVVIRLMGKYWGAITPVKAGVLEVRAGALDLAIAKYAAKQGLSGLSFLSGIPGSIGGAVATNAGCYGYELKDVCLQVSGLDRMGRMVRLQTALEAPDLPDIGFSYRHSNVPGDMIITSLKLKTGPAEDPEVLQAEITAHQARRAATQPIREKTSGSTFANPDPPGTENARSAWKLIDAAGCRGLQVGGAKVSDQHCNFLINTGAAMAADIEALGELVRAHVRETSGVDLRWEVRRIGRVQQRDNKK